VVTLHGYAKTPLDIVEFAIGPMKPGLEMYVETLGIAIVLTTEVCAQANQKKNALK
jgi:hypothetical protein